MHSAPTVSYPVGRSRFQGWLIVLTGLMALVLGMFWREQADLAGWRQGLFLVSLLVASGIALKTWLQTPNGALRWDGQAWSWTCGPAVIGGRVTVHLDLQFCMLLRMRTETGVQQWFWPERGVALPLWSALRCAVYSRASTVQTLAPPAGLDAVSSPLTP